MAWSYRRARYILKYQYPLRISPRFEILIFSRPEVALSSIDKQLYNPCTPPTKAQGRWISQKSIEAQEGQDVLADKTA
jgi:hypothetical protein